MITLKQRISKMSDGDLFEIYQEIETAVVPATGATHMMLRKINHLIDKGDMCINSTTYRKVYLPTFVREIQREMAHRYYVALRRGLNDEI